MALLLKRAIESVDVGVDSQPVKNVFYVLR